MSKVIKLSPEGLRKLQLTTLEMIVEVDRICRKHHIQYSLDGGTLLGAVRHHGFIPWDDDADIIFTRHEYARFCRVCKKELDEERFFLQDYRTDPEYRWGYAKLRRKGTEFIRSGQEHMRYRTGIYIDVFVVDHVPDQDLARKLYYGICFCLRKILYAELGMETADQGWLRGLYRILYRIPKNTCFCIRNRLAAACNRYDTDLVSHLLYPYPARACKYGVPAHCFQKYIEMEFEGMQFSIFEEYDEYLSLLYGDYMQYPPIEEQVGHTDASKIEFLEITLEEIQERYRKENVTSSVLAE